MSITKEMHIKGHKIFAQAYNEEKENTPIIFIHGIVANINFWEYSQPPIFEKFRWYSLSLPGHAPAEFPKGFQEKDLTPEMIARVLTSAIRKLVGDQPVILAGHSTGGFASLAIASQTPTIAKGVLSLAGFAHGQWIGGLGLLQWIARLPLIGKSLFKLYFNLLRINYKTFRASLGLYAADRKALYNWEFFEASLEGGYPYVKEIAPDAMYAYFNQMPDINISNWLSEITVPTLAVTGTKDPIVPPAQAELITKKVPNSRLLLLDDAGHLLTGERAEEYHSLLAKWLEELHITP